jgi:hypothetical protein
MLGAWLMPIYGSFDPTMSSLMATYFVLLRACLVVKVAKPES